MICHFALRALPSQCSLAGQMLKSVPLMQGFPIQSISKATCAFSWKVQTNPSYGGKKNIQADDLRKADVDHLLHLIERHSSVMSNKLLIHSLKCLVQFQENKVLSNTFTETSSFYKLSKRLLDRSDSFDSDSVLDVLKCLCALGIPSSSFLMQKYMLTLRQHINKLNINQILFLGSLLKKQDRSHLIDSLQSELVITMENFLVSNKQMDQENLNKLVSYFEFALEYNMNIKSLRCISDAILRNRETLLVSQAYNIVWYCIKQQNNQQMFSKLCYNAFKILNVDCDKLSSVQLVELVSIFNERIFYRSLVNKAYYRAVEEQWPLSLVHTMVCSTPAYEMNSEKLLNYYCDLIVESADEVKGNSKFLLLRMMEMFAKSGFVPKKSSKMLQLITNCEDKVNKLFEKPLQYLKFLLCFSVFDWYHPSIFERICNGKFVDDILRIIKERDSDHHYKNNILKQLLLLHQLVSVHDYMINLPEDLKLMAMNAKREENLTFPLEPVLHRGLGGKNYVLSGIFTRSGIFIDHYIAMSQRDYSVVNEEQFIKFNSFKVLPYVEDIQIPSDGKRIAIIVHASKGKFTDKVVVTGLDRLPVRLLKQEGFHVVEVNLSSWEKLSDSNRIPYLMKTIRNLNKDKTKDHTFGLT